MGIGIYKEEVNELRKMRKKREDIRVVEFINWYYCLRIGSR